MKYVITKDGDAVMFSETIEHVTMKSVMRGRSVAGGEITSAGFVDVGTDKANNVTVHCHGRSVSLGGIESDPKRDEAIIKRAIMPKDY